MFVNRPESIDNNFLCSLLHCIPKPNGGIRPIAVEEVFLKLVNKVVCDILMQRTYKKLHNNQFCIKSENSQIIAVKALKDNIKAGYHNGE